MKRITYVSRFTKPFTESELHELGEISAKNNQSAGVTGVLMTSGGIFFQTLEGPVEAVDQIYDSIAADSRHTDLVILGLEIDVTERNYPDWSMKTVNLDAVSHVRLLPLKVMMETVYEQQLLIDKMLWAIDRTLKHEMRNS